MCWQRFLVQQVIRRHKVNQLHWLPCTERRQWSTITYTIDCSNASTVLYCCYQRKHSNVRIYLLWSRLTCKTPPKMQISLPTIPGLCKASEISVRVRRKTICKKFAIDALTHCLLQNARDTNVRNALFKADEGRHWSFVNFVLQLFRILCLHGLTGPQVSHMKNVHNTGVLPKKWSWRTERRFVENNILHSRFYIIQWDTNLRYEAEVFPVETCGCSWPHHL